MLAADRRVTKKYMEVTRNTVEFHDDSAAVRSVVVVLPDLADDGCQGRLRPRGTWCCRTLLTTAVKGGHELVAAPSDTKTVLSTRKVMTVMEILHAVRYLFYYKGNWQLATGKTVAGSMARAPA